MLLDPREAPGDGDDPIAALVGLSAAAVAVRALAGAPAGPAGPADDFVHLLLGVAGLGELVDRLAGVDPDPGRPR